MNKTRKYLAVSAAEQEHIAKAMSCTTRAVREAASYRSDSDFAKRVREYARKRGTILMVNAPACECWYEEDGRYMRQLYDNGAQLIADKVTGDVRVFDRKKNVIVSANNARISELRAMQEVAAGL